MAKFPEVTLKCESVETNLGLSGFAMATRDCHWYREVVANTSNSQFVLEGKFSGGSAS